MERSFWSSRWQQQRIGFHRDDVNPNLVNHAEGWLGQRRTQGATADAPFAGLRVLVPLCGKTLDLLWLAERGAHVIGVEFVEQAAQAFFTEHQIDVGVTQHGLAKCLAGRLPSRDGVASGALEIWVADFFSLTPESLGRLDAVYDRAALVAVPPERRIEYVEQLGRLTAPDARVLLVSFEHDTGSGPPFSVPPAEVRELFDEHFRGVLVSDEDILAQEPQFQARGAARFHEHVWLWTRV